MFEGTAPATTTAMTSPVRTHRARMTMRPGTTMPQGPSSVFLPTGPRLTRGMLAGMALLVLLMPMNYRAGTETDHPHAFFQEVIDLVTGTPHEHGAAVGMHTHDEATGAHDHHAEAGAATDTAAATATVSPFLAADIPLAAAVTAATAGTSPPVANPSTSPAGAPSRTADTLAWHAGAAIDRDRDTAVASRSPDLPGVTNVTPAAEKASAILVLATVLAGLLLAPSRRRTLADAVQRLTAIARPVDAPPPRFVPC